MRYYSAHIKITGVTTGKTLAYVTAAANKAVEIVSAVVVGGSTTNQQGEFSWQKVTTLGTPTGTALTPSKHDIGDAAFGSTCVGNVTASEPTYSSGPAVEDGHEYAPLLSGYLYPSIPRVKAERLRLAGGETWGLRSLATLTSIDLTVTLVLGEEG